MTKPEYVGKSRNRKDSFNVASKRTQLRKEIAWRWIKKHKPRVAEAIFREVEAKYPRARMGSRYGQETAEIFAKVEAA